MTISANIKNKNFTKYLLNLQNITVSFNDKLLFNDICLSIKYNGLVVIKGEVGSGKTTLLKMLAGLITPSQGEISNIDSCGKVMRPIFLHAMPEFNFVTGYVIDELHFAGLDTNDFKDILHKSIFDLSGGEMKKLAIMMGLSSNSDSVLLLDEPLDMLDDIESAAVADLIISSSKTRPFIIATHDKLFDKVADVVINITR